MIKTHYKMRAKVWLYSGSAAWHFITLPKKHGAEIKKLFGGPMRRGWGSVPVTVTIGETRWKTSIFPESKSGSYVLPLKADVRKKERILKGDTITFEIDVDAPWR